MIDMLMITGSWTFALVIFVILKIRRPKHRYPHPTNESEYTMFPMTLVLYADPLDSVPSSMVVVTNDEEYQAALSSTNQPVAFERVA